MARKKQQEVEFNDEARRLAMAAIRRLGKIMDESENDLAVVAAAKEINNRAYGQAKQTLESQSTVLHVSYRKSLEELNKRIKDRKATATITDTKSGVTHEAAIHVETAEQEEAGLPLDDEHDEED